MKAIWIVLMCAACDGTGSTGSDDGAGDDGSGDDGSGDDGAGDGGGDDGGGGEGAKVSDVSSECTDSGMSLAGFTASSEADGVHVIDTYPYSCCAVFDVTVAVAEEKHWATATYTNVGEKCDCMCTYDVRYVVSGLESGTWTIESPTGATVDVTI